jgi:hypothetical protein
VHGASVPGLHDSSSEEDENLVVDDAAPKSSSTLKPGSLRMKLSSEDEALVL